MRKFSSLFAYSTSTHNFAIKFRIIAALCAFYKGAERFVLSEECEVFSCEVDTGISDLFRARASCEGFVFFGDMRRFEKFKRFVVWFLLLRFDCFCLDYISALITFLSWPSFCLNYVSVLTTFLFRLRFCLYYVSIWTTFLSWLRFCLDYFSVWIMFPSWLRFRLNYVSLLTTFLF